MRTEVPREAFQCSVALNERRFPVSNDAAPDPGPLRCERWQRFYIARRIISIRAIGATGVGIREAHTRRMDGRGREVAPSREKIVDYTEEGAGAING